MLLNKLKIQNLRNIKEGDIDFKRGSTLIRGENASGKCLSANTRIYLSNGQIMPICRIVDEKIDSSEQKIITDENIEVSYNHEPIGVMSINSNLKIVPSNIKAFMRRPAPDYLYKITNSYGNIISATANHPIPVATMSGVKFVPAKEIAVGDYVITPANLKRDSGKRNYQKSLMKLLGYSCAKGRYDRRRLSFTNSDPYLLADFEKCLSEYVGHECIISRFYKSRNNTQQLYYYLPKQEIDNFKLFETVGQTSGKKCLPVELIENMSQEDFLSFLLAYIDGDGEVRHRRLLSPSGKKMFQWRISATSKSKELIFQLQYLLLSCGISSTVKPTKKKAPGWEKRKTYWRLFITNANDAKKILKNDKFQIPQKKLAAQKILLMPSTYKSNSKVNVIPRELVIPIMSHILRKLRIKKSVGKSIPAVVGYRARPRLVNTTYYTINEVISFIDRQINTLLRLKTKLSGEKCDIHTIKESVKSLGITYQRISDDTRISRPELVKALNLKTHMTNMYALQKYLSDRISELIEDIAAPLTTLKIIAAADVRWARVEKVAKVRPAEKYVYDIETDNHTLTAEGFIVHNSSARLAVELSLYGSVTGHLRENLIRYGTNNLSVELTFEHGGTTYTVRRNMRKENKKIDSSASLAYNETTIQGPTKVTDRIIEIFGIDQKTWNIINPPQGQIADIIYLTSTERATAFDSIFGIERFRKTYEKMRDILKPIESAKDELKGKVLALESVIHEINIDELKQKIKTLNDELKTKKEQLLAASNELASERMSLSKIESDLIKVKEAQEAKTTLQIETKELDIREKQIKETIEDIKQTENKITEIASKKKELLDKKAELPDIELMEKQVEEKRRHMIEIEKKASAASERALLSKKNIEIIETSENCPVCSQPITQHVRNYCIEQLNKEVSSALKEKGILMKDIGTVNEEVATMEKKIEGARVVATELAAGLREADALLTITQEHLSIVNESYKQMLEQIDDKRRSIQWLSEKVEKTKEILGRAPELEEAYKKTRDNIGAIETKIAILETEITTKGREACDTNNLIGDYETKKTKLDKDKKMLDDVNKLLMELAMIREMFKEIGPLVREYMRIMLEDQLRHLFDLVRETIHYDDIALLEDYSIRVSRRGAERLSTECSGAEKLILSILLRMAMARVLMKAEVGGAAIESIIIDEVEEAGLDPESLEGIIHLLEKIQLTQLIVISHNPLLQERVGQHVYLFEAVGPNRESNIRKLA